MKIFTKNRDVRLVSVIILILIQGLSGLSVHAQDKHGYDTPLGRSVFYRNVTDAVGTTVSMSEISSLSQGVDGLMVLFNLRADLSGAQPLKLLTFTLQDEANSIIDIFYDSGTLRIDRRFQGDYKYDYILYDPLFVQDQGTLTWEVRVYFTSSFFWFQTRNTRQVTNNKYHCPLFFGLDKPGNKSMDRFLKRESAAKIMFGSSTHPVGVTMPDEIAIYEFKYSELRNTLNDNFSKDN